MGSDDRDLVGLFFARARELAGSEKALAKLIEPWVGAQRSRTTVNAWVSGRNNPPAFLLFRLARHYGLSLDELLMDAEDHRTLQEQLHEVRSIVAELQQEMQRLLSVRGEEPMSFPEAAEDR